MLTAPRPLSRILGRRRPTSLMFLFGLKIHPSKPPSAHEAWILQPGLTNRHRLHIEIHLKSLSAASILVALSLVVAIPVAAHRPRLDAFTTTTTTLISPGNTLKHKRLLASATPDPCLLPPLTTQRKTPFPTYSEKKPQPDRSLCNITKVT